MLMIGRDLGVAEDKLLTGNGLLSTLRPADRRLLLPCLIPAVCRRGDVLFSVGDDVSMISFPLDRTITTLTIVMQDGRAVETATIGREGAIGGVVSQGSLPAFSQAVVQIGGPILRMEAVKLQEFKRQSTPLRNLFTRYSDCLLAQVLQNVACNALHPIEQRCARWLLTVQDRLGTEALPVTHEMLAEMLGVQRTYVTRILGVLQGQGLIEVGRGRVTILNRASLLDAACECHDTIAAHFARVLGTIYAGDPVVALAVGDG